MASAEITSELQRAATNVRNLTTALRTERQGRAQDKQDCDRVVSEKDAKIQQLEEQVATLTKERDETKQASTEQAGAVASGVNEIEAANKEAEEALADNP